MVEFDALHCEMIKAHNGEAPDLGVLPWHGIATRCFTCAWLTRNVGTSFFPLDAIRISNSKVMGYGLDIKKLTLIWSIELDWLPN